MNIQYIAGNENLLDEIKKLWEELNRIHLEKSPHFKEHYAGSTFESRKRGFLAIAQNGQLSIRLAYEAELLIGYCVAGIVDEIGEIESIFVLERYRGYGIAANFMEQSLDWLKEKNPKKIVLKVSVGNEEVLGFYAKYGFLPRLMELQLVSE